MSILAKKYFRDEAAAFAHLESLLWPEGPVCPHCGAVGNAGRLQGVRTKPSKKHPEGVVRHGLWKCYEKECRKQFTVKISTVFEDAHIPLHKCLQVAHLLCSSKKGFSAHQISRILEVDYKSAWFLAHRIREAMRVGTLAPMGGQGGVVEVDETYIGKLDHVDKIRNPHDKNMVLTLVERGGSARSFHMDGMAIRDIMPILRENIARESRVNTDESKSYYDVGKAFAGHDTVNHSRDEYARRTADPSYKITTNTVEGYYSIFKRGMKGVYQHCKEKHLHRYLAEFDFRYSNRVALGVDDEARTVRVLKGAAGKRLTYRNPHVTAAE